MSFTEEDEEPEECDVCGAEASFVKYDNDKTCKKCGYRPTESTITSKKKSEWEQWWEHRSDMYSGLRGEDRVKMVGGFASAWDEFNF